MNAQRAYSLETRPVVVLADGPYETDGDGAFDYCVCFGDDNGEAITENKRAVWRLWDYAEVERFGRELADRFGLEFINEAMKA